MAKTVLIVEAKERERRGREGAWLSDQGKGSRRSFLSRSEKEEKRGPASFTKDLRAIPLCRRKKLFWEEEGGCDSYLGKGRGGGGKKCI